LRVNTYVTQRFMSKLNASALTTHFKGVITTRYAFSFIFQVGLVLYKMTYTSEEVNNFANICLEGLKLYRQLQK